MVKRVMCHVVWELCEVWSPLFPLHVKQAGFTCQNGFLGSRACCENVYTSNVCIDLKLTLSQPVLLKKIKVLKTLTLSRNISLPYFG